MKTASQVGTIGKESSYRKNFAIDTSFVLFFLAIEFGQSVSGVSFESGFLAITLLMVTILPYFTYSGQKPDFGNWLLGRGIILGFAIVLGILWKQALGVILPTEFRFIPMTLLIIAAVMSCLVQFSGFVRLHLAR